MAGETLGEVIRRLGRSGGLQGDLAQTDAQLLERFARRRDGPAFAALLARHGPMVLGVCRRLLPDAQEAEDAFQAAFLVLARRASAVQRQSLLGPWLYGVAWRVAARLRGRSARRRGRETPGVDLNALPADDAAWSDIRWVVHEEVQRLPDAYRSAVILCCLEGKTNEEAARVLRRPVGTVKSRLARARELLRSRLARRGMAVSVGVLGTALAANTATASAALAAAAIRVALPFAAGGTVAGGVVSARAIALAQGVLRTMVLKKAMIVATLALVVALLGGVGGVAYRAWAAEPGDGPKAAARAADQPRDEKPKDDKEALQGEWRVLAVETEGVQRDDEVARDLKKGTWVIQGDKVIVHIKAPGPARDAKFTCTLDPSQTPKTIDLTSDTAADDSKEKSIYGVYSVEGDVLKICYAMTGVEMEWWNQQRGKRREGFRELNLLLPAGPRPKEVATREGSKTTLMTLKREPAGKDKPEEDKPKAAPADGAPPPTGPRGEKEQKLLQDWCDTANEAFKLRKEQFVAGESTGESLASSARRLLTAELERAEKKEERVAAYEAHLRRITDIAKVLKARQAAGQAAASDIADAEYHRLEAEILLEREKAK